MEILLSPQSSANVWIQSRQAQARIGARKEGYKVDDECWPLPGVVPPMSRLLKAETVPACQLEISTRGLDATALGAMLNQAGFGLAAARSGQRRNWANNKWIALPTPLSTQPVYRLAEGVCICSPAVSFLMSAAQLKLPSVAQLLTELCSEYALDPGIEHGFGKCSPLLDVHVMECVSGLALQVKGRVNFRAAMPFVAAGAESPRETAMQLLFAMPTTQGGMGLPLGEFGHKVLLSARAKSLYGKKSCRCDLFYAGAGLDIEYESDQEHAGDANRKKDARREAALAMEGIEVIPVTSQEVASLTHMNALGHLIASRLGKRLQIRVHDYPLKQYALSESLLGRSGWRF